MPGSNACNGIMLYVPLCYIQIQSKLLPSLTSRHLLALTNMTQRRQHVGNVSSVVPYISTSGNVLTRSHVGNVRADVPCILRFASHFCNCVNIN